MQCEREEAGSPSRAGADEYAPRLTEATARPGGAFWRELWHSERFNRDEEVSVVSVHIYRE